MFATEETLESSYIKLPSAYFRKLENLIGPKRLEKDGNVSICIWKDDMPVRFLVVIDGELVDTNASLKLPSLNHFQLLDLIDKEVERDGGKTYDFAVSGDTFVSYENHC